MISLDVLKPILGLTLQESRRDNLLSCSCHEFFDSMRRENHKELIAHVMTNHEEQVRILAKTPLGSQRFELFIKRYEINKEGPPATSAPPPVVDNPRRPGTSLGNIDAEEESYFNGDDDDEDNTNVVSIEPSWQKQRPSTLLSSVPISNLKRKRRPGITAGAASASSSSPKGSPRQTPPRSSTPLGSLLDYGDDDDEESQEESQSPKEVAIPPTPQLSAATLPLKPSPKDDDSDDELENSYLESLASKSRGQSPAPESSPQAKAPSLGPMRLPEKRRRGESDDGDDDQLLERLRKSKKVDQGAASKEAPSSRGNNTTNSLSSKTSDDPPKKTIKVKLSSTSLSLGAKPKADATPTPVAPASTLPSPPRSSPDSTAKDGDTG